MTWSVLTKKQQYVVIGTAGLIILQLLIAAHLSGWMTPASGRSAAARKELAELEQKIATARTVTAQKEAILKELERSIEKLESLAAYAPASSDRYAWAYEYISRCAAQAGLSLDSLEETADCGSGTYDPSYGIRVSTHCGYNELIGFLWRLETDSPLVRINEVTIAAVQGEPQSQRGIIFMHWPETVQIESGR
jgi:hypothetical protein